MCGSGTRIVENVRPRVVLRDADRNAHACLSLNMPRRSLEVGSYPKGNFLSVMSAPGYFG